MTALAPILEAFFTDRLMTQRGASPHTIASYRDTYFAGLRPEEALSLRRDDVTLPPLMRNEGTGQWDEPSEDDDWGELHLRNATPEAGAAWTDDREEPRGAPAQAPSRGRHQDRPGLPGADQAATSATARVRRAGWPPIHRCPPW